VTKTVLRGAILGTGNITYHHLAAWQRIPGVEIVALYNRTVERAIRRAEQFGIAAAHVYGDYHELLANEALDFVDIATPPDLHREQVKAAAARGLHILCQKPLAPTLDDVETMIAACDRAGIILAVNENWRWRAWYRQAKQWLDARQIGTVRYARITAHYTSTLVLPDGTRPSLLTTQPYVRDMPRLILFEWGVHLIDTLRMLFGEVDWVFCDMKKVSPLFAGEDRALVVLGLGAVTAIIDISWASVTGVRPPSVLEDVVIEGDEGTIALVPNQGHGDLISMTDWHGTTLPDEVRRGSMIRQTALPAHNGDLAAAYQASFDAAQQNFIDCLRQGTQPETAATDNIKTLQATFAAYESAASRQVIYLNRIPSEKSDDHIT